MFTMLILASTVLFKITDYLVQGVSPLMIMEFFFLLLPGVMAKTFTMAMLLATLLAFGRLSSDSEIVAMRAAGANIYRIMLPVAIFSFSVAVFAFILNETIVPASSQKRLALEKTLARTLDVKSAQPTSKPLFDRGELRGYMVAKDFNLSTRTLRGVTLVMYDKAGKTSAYMDAKELIFDEEKFSSGNGGWRITGGATITRADGNSVVHIDDEAWPTDFVQLGAKPSDLLAAKTNDPDVFSIAQLIEQIRLAKLDPKFDQGKISNMEFWLWNKFALPLAALIFGLLGAPLGIRNHRTGTAIGFALSVAIIFGYMMLANVMNVLAMGHVIPAFVASFTPLVIGMIAAVIIMRRKNL